MTTLPCAMYEALTDEALHDVVLEGTDGVTVDANKAILAIRSPVLKGMFFGNFQKSYSNPLNYHSTVLRVLVKYCYTDELDLDLIYSDEKDDVQEITDDEAVLMTQLRDAANYFELPFLHKAITEELGGTIIQNASLGCICAVLSELWERSDVEGPFWRILKSMVQMQPQKTLFPSSTKWNKGIVTCPWSLVRELVRGISAFGAAYSLEEWNKAHAETFLEGNPESETVKQELLELANGIDLTSIPPSQLRLIKPSELFSVERLYQAFVDQTEQWRGNNGWRQGSGDNAFDITSSDISSSSCAIVEGAGVKCLDGVYNHTVDPKYGPVYIRNGFYGEVKCTFKLLKISLKLVVCIDGGQQELVLYESKLPFTNEVPFASWTCCDGKDPAPFVAISGVEQDGSNDDASNPTTASLAFGATSTSTAATTSPFGFKFSSPTAALAPTTTFQFGASPSSQAKATTAPGGGLGFKFPSATTTTTTTTAAFGALPPPLGGSNNFFAPSTAAANQAAAVATTPGFSFPKPTPAPVE